MNSVPRVSCLAASGVDHDMSEPGVISPIVVAAGGRFCIISTGFEVTMLMRV